MVPPLLLTMWLVHHRMWLKHGYQILKSQRLQVGYKWVTEQLNAREYVINAGNQTRPLENLLMADSVRIYSKNATPNLSEALREYHAPTRDVKVEEMGNCSTGKQLVGPLYVNQDTIPNIEEVEKAFSLTYGGWVEKGGAWKPQHCQAGKKVAIVIPYRNRYEQVKMFLRHIHPILKRQLLDYRIFIVEQEGSALFNRAMLFNIGFKESLGYNNYQCFIFHDVDLLPENDRNLYGCPSSPRHMCPAVDKFSYKLLYQNLFGGVEAFAREHFEKINGFSNKYWGWGGEDDDLQIRVHAVALKLTRPSMNHGRYKMITTHHFVDGKKSEERYKLLTSARGRMHSDGLSSLKYKLVKSVEHLLYTHILVQLDQKTV